MDAPSAIESLLSRRRVAVYEERTAAQAYAYGVDLRRAEWFQESSVGVQVMRVIDRAWPLALESLRALYWRHDPEIDGALARTTIELARRLRAPVPALVALRNDAPTPWPTITAIGPQNPGAGWISLDLTRFRQLSPLHQRFALGSALGQTQCGHAAYVLGRWLLQAQLPNRWLLATAHTILRPWHDVMVFSSDRAGLAACLSLPDAIEALTDLATTDLTAPWLGVPATLDQRITALKDFDQSTAMRRFRALARRTPADSQLADAAEATAETQGLGLGEDAQDRDSPSLSLAECDARLTRRLRLF